MLNRPGDVTKFDQTQVAVLSAIFDEIFLRGVNIKYTSTVPTSSTAGENEIIVYDDGAGTKRIYVITGKGNLGYIDLT